MLRLKMLDFSDCLRTWISSEDSLYALFLTQFLNAALSPNGWNVQIKIKWKKGGGSRGEIINVFYVVSFKAG